MLYLFRFPKLNARGSSAEKKKKLSLELVDPMQTLPTSDTPTFTGWHENGDGSAESKLEMYRGRWALLSPDYLVIATSKRWKT